jgi:hypothetical protein
MIPKKTRLPIPAKAGTEGDPNELPDKRRKKDPAE